MPPTAAAAKPSDTPSLYVQGWLSAQDAAVPPSQTEVTSGDERTSPVSASQERTGASTSPLPLHEHDGLQQSQ
jgi:hypothetical protein